MPKLNNKPAPKRDTWIGTNTGYSWDVGVVAFDDPLQAMGRREKKLKVDRERMKKNRKPNQLNE